MKGGGCMEDSQVFVGMDVSKICLDVAARPTGEVWRVANDAAGIGDLARQLTGMSPSLVVLEATGGLERKLAAGLAVAGLPVAVVNPRHVRDFAQRLWLPGQDRHLGRPSVGPLRSSDGA